MLKKMLEKVGKLWLLLGVTFLFFLGLEAVSAIFLHSDYAYRLHSRRMTTWETRLTGSDLKNIPALIECDKEASHFKPPQWDPYDYWRMSPFQGDCIHVSFDGLRETWNRSRPGLKPLTIFTFGGSAVFGLYNRDNYTISSYLSKILTQTTNLNVHVVNFGQPGYITTQELIAFLRQLQQGHRPDVAIFHDLWNDVSPYPWGPGTTYTESDRAREFDLLNPIKRVEMVKQFFLALTRESQFFTVCSHVKEKLIHFLRRHSVVTNEASAPAVEEVLKIYTANIKLAESLCRSYGVHCLFYVQPMLRTKRHWTPYELAQSRLPWFDLHEDFVRRVYHQVELSPDLNADPNFHNVSHLLDGYRRTMFIDDVHLTEEANEIVARRMADDILQDVRNSR